MDDAPLSNIPAARKYRRFTRSAIWPLKGKGKVLFMNPYVILLYHDTGTYIQHSAYKHTVR